MNSSINCREAKVVMSYQADINQLNVINAPIDSRLVVTAGPGSGKTFTAAQRLIRLVNEDSDGLNFLAVSFSRAAAQAIENALAVAGLRGRVEIRTIDSWAYRLNQRFADPEEIAITSTYEDGIELALRTLRNNESAIYELIDYLIVDEAQDIFGVRSELIQEMCKSSWMSGWAILGDVAQKIYDFVNESEADRESLLESVLAKAEDFEIEKHELLTDFRCSNSELFRIRELGSEIRSIASARDQYSLWNEFNMLQVLGSMEELVGALSAMASDDLSTAVLTRTNRLALEVSSRLSAAQIPHRMVSGSTDYVVPEWVVGLQNCRTKSELLEACPSFIDPELLAIEVTKLCGRGKPDAFDFTLLAQAISSRRVPGVLLEGDRRGVALSSIHQSKGLEFDRVVLETERPVGSNEELLAETRLLFVGLTRAKSEVFRFHIGDRMDSHRRQGRLIDVIYRKAPVPIRIEIKPSDVQFLRPIRNEGNLEIRLIAQSDSGLPIYGVFELDAVVCLANISESFSRTVRSEWRNSPPLSFSGLQSVGEQTIARPLSYSQSEQGSHLVTVPVFRAMLEVEEKKHV